MLLESWCAFRAGFRAGDRLQVEAGRFSFSGRRQEIRFVKAGAFPGEFDTGSHLGLETGRFSFSGRRKEIRFAKAGALFRVVRCQEPVKG